MIIPVDSPQMWRYRIKPNLNDNNNSRSRDRRIPTNPEFNHQSLKDIQSLFTHDDNHNHNSNTTQNEPSSPSQKSVFQRVHLANKITRAFSRPKTEPQENVTQVNKSTPACDQSETFEITRKSIKSEPKVKIPGGDKRVVVYMTSIRAVRSTFEACKTVRSILQGFRVPVDERDLAMDSAFSDEIRKIMAQIGHGYNGKRVELPRVFIGGRYIGGADEVLELHEMGELKKFMAGLPAATPGVCKSCGDFRFNLCYECNGSHKCHLEDGGFTTCMECNENGLIRCTFCLCD